MALGLPTRQVRDIPRGGIADQAWWAYGDTPVRVAESLTPLVDGRATMLALCAAFLAAKERIWLADWDLHARLLMVRGRDQRAGPDGSPEQEALLARLRAAGLDDDALAQWASGALRVIDVLGFAAQRGVDVRVLLWHPYNPFGLIHMINNARANWRTLTAEGIACRLDKSSRSRLHAARALHQKCAVVDARTAFIGGVDMTVQFGGDFDRWDTPAHLFEGMTRRSDLGPSPHPWHDAHVMVVGEPARDVARNFVQRWEEAGRPWYRRAAPPLVRLTRMYASGQRASGQRALLRSERGVLPPGAGPEVAGAGARVQVIRTIPALTYRFAPAGIHGIAQAYTLAARRAERFIYLESQYLWLETFIGLKSPRVGPTSHHMKALLTELATAAERGVTIALVLPDHPNCGRAYTDATIAWLREQAPHAAAEGRLHFFCLATSAPHAKNGMMRYRPIYVHAKVAVVDDRWATLGSANLNSRGMGHDAELNLAVLDTAFARSLRLLLWSEHTGLQPEAHTGWPAPAALPLLRPLEMPSSAGVSALAEVIEPWRESVALANGAVEGAGAGRDAMEVAWSRLEDPVAGIGYLADCASRNLTRLRAGEALAGQLLPYLRAEEGEANGVVVDKERGLLNPLRAAREGVRVRHHGKYV
ncbi:MAG: Cardiolipin synthetase [Ktedonobacterales bacterium]|nr:MAG: Cardiolipin synthetase [Ktedonobacterales bacterium]